MASYRALDIGMDPSSLGLVAAAFAILPVVFALSIGRTIDRLGEFPFLLGSAALMAVASIALALIGTAVALLGLAQLTFVVANIAAAAQLDLARLHSSGSRSGPSHRR